MFCFVVVAIVVSWCMYVSWCTYVCSIWEVPLYRQSCLLVQPFPLQLDKSDNNNNNNNNTDVRTISILRNQARAWFKNTSGI